MNIMNVTEELLCIRLISAPGTTVLITFRSGNMIIMGTQCCIFIIESLNFIMAKLLKLGVNYS